MAKRKGRKKRKGKGCGLSRNMPAKLVPACEAGVLGTFKMAGEKLGR